MNMIHRVLHWYCMNIIIFYHYQNMVSGRIEYRCRHSVWCSFSWNYRPPPPSCNFVRANVCYQGLQFTLLNIPTNGAYKLHENLL